MTIRMASDAAALILAEASRAAPRECCGLLLGQNRDGMWAHIAQARPAVNVAADPSRHFEIDPAALIAAERDARQGGAALIGYYHSHPNGLAEPSATDREMAHPDGRVWLIAADGSLRAFRAPDRPGGTFRPIMLEIDAPGLA